jgi:hypothetical protein
LIQILEKSGCKAQSSCPCKNKNKTKNLQALMAASFSVTGKTAIVTGAGSGEHHLE